MREMNLTATGNLTGDPELRYVGKAPVVAFTVAVNRTRYNTETQKHEDAGVSFVRCQAWRSLAENIAACLGKGDRVIVTGRWEEQHWEDKGEKRSAWRLTAESAGPDLTWATAKPQKAVRRPQDGPPDDPWATGTPEPPADDEPPF